MENLIGKILLCINGGGTVQVTCHGRASKSYRHGQENEFRMQAGEPYALYGRHWIHLADARVSFYQAKEKV